MLGATLLSVPWAFGQSGLAAGIVSVFLLGGLTCYTAWLIIRNGKGYLDFAEKCEETLGRWSYYAAQIVSVVVLFGALISYHCIISANLFSIVEAIREFSGDIDPATGHAPPCWFSAQIAPLFVFGFLFPLTLVRDLKLLVRLSSFGIVPVVFITFVIIFTGCTTTVPGGINWKTVTWVNMELPETLGILSLAFFVHNLTLAFFRNARDPSTNGRNLLIAFLINAVIYCSVGAIGYIGYHDFTPQGAAAPAILDNYLKMLPETNILALAARVALLLQMSICFPLLFKMMRQYFLTLVLPVKWMKNGALIRATTALAKARKAQQEQSKVSPGNPADLESGIDSAQGALDQPARPASESGSINASAPAADEGTESDTAPLIDASDSTPAPPAPIDSSSPPPKCGGADASEDQPAPEPEFYLLSQVLPATVLFFGATLMFAMFYPNIGLVLRFSGAFCGLVYIYGLPVLVEMLVRRRRHVEFRAAVLAGAQPVRPEAATLDEASPLVPAGPLGPVERTALSREQTRYWVHFCLHGLILLFGLSLLFLQFFF
ncbi:Transmembrane amino acid transporter [Paratrimastix pyriformis]|uniref:Transmembrane amino acid transporter n=1 Tax=Paratrimastix pyriformis TaxID=342808 RepID=A0ABQ8UIP5_9EUKA|nr:Transmembrane amino acid transporter [Paratrimastix pyriformis]